MKNHLNRVPMSAFGQIAADLDNGRIAEQMGVSRRTIIRWRKAGVPIFQLDRVACALGRHPSEVWPDYV